MYGVELYAAVRLAVVPEGLSHHEAGRRVGIDRRTVKKMFDAQLCCARQPDCQNLVYTYLLTAEE